MRKNHNDLPLWLLLVYFTAILLLCNIPATWEASIKHALEERAWGFASPTLDSAAVQLL